MVKSTNVCVGISGDYVYVFPNREALETYAVAYKDEAPNLKEIYDGDHRGFWDGWYPDGVDASGEEIDWMLSAFMVDRFGMAKVEYVRGRYNVLNPHSEDV